MTRGIPADLGARPVADQRITGLDLWQRKQPGVRRPELSLEQITDAAISIADEEGLSALTMRRLASILEVGTMSLYHHVHTKKDLLALICDRAMVDAIVSEHELAQPWPDSMIAIAHRSLEMLQNHPWFLEIVDPATGPNVTRHFDQTLQVVMRLDLTFTEQVALANTVDEYVYGYFAYDHPFDPDEIVDIAGPMETLINTGHYPALKALSEDMGLSTALSLIGTARNDPDRFGRNLKQLLNQYNERQCPQAMPE